MRCCFRNKPGIASCLVMQECLKRSAPAGRKRFDSQRALELVARMIWRVEERINLCDRHSLLRLSRFHDFVACPNITFSENAEIESRPSAGSQQSGHSGLIHANADAITSHTRLSYFE